jgi:RNA polymerase sigma-70 factor (ECF subfamily)
LVDWEQLVRGQGPSVFAAAWRVLGHAADAEDVVQDVFTEAYRLHRTNAVRNWPGLLVRMATCRALDRLRKRTARATEPLTGVEPTTAAGPDENAAAGELAAHLRAALVTLSETEATTFCLRHFEDMSYESIAAELDTTVGTVAVVLHRARAALAVRLRAFAADGG